MLKRALVVVVLALQAGCFVYVPGSGLWWCTDEPPSGYYPGCFYVQP